MADEAWPIAEPFGPTYPDLPGAAKFRRAAKNGLRDLTREQRQEYGAAVGEGIKALQRPSPRVGTAKPNCASRTWFSDGADIHKAIREQQKRALTACPAAIRAAREPKEWRKMYAEAMAEKCRAGA